jgi:coenzyme Q-binding protein COQ10
LILPVVETRRRINVPPDLAFEIAADVGAYQQFLPLMQKSVILGAKKMTTDGEVFKAELSVAYPKFGLSGSFVSEVESFTSARTVTARSTDGPFRAVETTWRILPAATGSDVAIRIDYAFRSPLLQLGAASVMDIAVSRVISAFEDRALRLLIQRNALKQA